MPAPTGFTELALANYMRAEIQGIADDLGLLDTTPVTGNYVKPVTDTEVALGVTDVAVASQSVGLIQVHAKVQIWTYVVAAYVRAFSVGGLARTLARNQLFDHARYMLETAKADLAHYGEDQLEQETGQGASPVPLSGALAIKQVW